jgi:hypothetical protein
VQLMQRLDAVASAVGRAMARREAVVELVA